MRETNLAIDENGKNSPSSLWWFDTENKKYLPAGVAFYDEKFGEYRLKIDVHPDTCYYLKPVATNDGKSVWRAEVVIKSNGKFKFRRSVGEGYSDDLTGGDIIVQFGPYSKLLVLGGDKQDE